MGKKEKSAEYAEFAEGEGRKAENGVVMFGEDEAGPRRHSVTKPLKLAFRRLSDALRLCGYMAKTICPMRLKSGA
jgi:hypothetical protein